MIKDDVRMLSKGDSTKLVITTVDRGSVGTPRVLPESAFIPDFDKSGGTHLTCTKAEDMRRHSQNSIGIMRPYATYRGNRRTPLRVAGLKSIIRLSFVALFIIQRNHNLTDLDATSMTFGFVPRIGARSVPKNGKRARDDYARKDVRPRDL